MGVDIFKSRGQSQSCELRLRSSGSTLGVERTYVFLDSNDVIYARPRSPAHGGSRNTGHVFFFKWNVRFMLGIKPRLAIGELTKTCSLQSSESSCQGRRSRGRGGGRGCSSTLTLKPGGGRTEHERAPPTLHTEQNLRQSLLKMSGHFPPENNRDIFREILHINTASTANITPNTPVGGARTSNHQS